MAQAATKTLYDRDFSLWLEDITASLKARDFAKLDFDNLIEEIEGLSNRDRDEIESRLEVLLIHILKRVYIDSSYDNHGWQETIIEQRRRLIKKLQKSPSLKRYFVDVFDDCWQFSLAKVRRDYPQYQFPDTWQFNRDVDAVLNEEFWYQ